MLLSKMSFSFCIYVFLLLLSVCSAEDDPLGGAEDFLNADRPFFSLYTSSYYNYYLLKPWNYHKEFNETRSYPLVIYLHGSGGAGNITYQHYLGYDDDDGNDNQTAVHFQTNQPAFVLIPQTLSSWNTTTLINLTESIKAGYRIHTSRIYLIGYSMGGSGSYSFINAYHDYNGQLFAGLIRLAGQSQTTVRNAIAEHTKIWLHIGLSDTATRIQVTRDAYSFLTNYHSVSSEIINDVPISAYPGKTYSVTLNGRTMFCRTEYETPVGHGISALPFNDPDLMQWLFKE